MPKVLSCGSISPAARPARQHRPGQSRRAGATAAKMHFEEQEQLRRQDEKYTKEEKGEEKKQEEEKKSERLYVSTGPDIFAFPLPCLLFASSDLHVGVLQLSLAGSACGGRGRRAVKVGQTCYGPWGLGAACRPGSSGRCYLYP